MHRLLLSLALLGAVSPLLASGEVPFDPSGESFANPAACKARLAGIVADARGREHVAVNGPYDVAAGDVRVHAVVVSGRGHRITEHRCLAEKLSSRTWRHSMSGSESEEPETIESMAAQAEWLKKTPKR
jgi:hypothetical protein